jgi:hypothetical protein
MNVIHRGKLRHVEFILAAGDIFDAGVDAIVNSEQTDFVLSGNPDSKPDTEPGLEKWIGINAEYAKAWPNISVKKEPPTDAKEWEGVAGKEQYFSPNPGAGD